MLDRLRDAAWPRDPSVVHARGGDGQTPLHSRRDRRDGGVPARARRGHRRARRRSRVHAGAVAGPRSARTWRGISCSRGCSADILIGAALGDLGRVARHLDRDPSAVRTSVRRDVGSHDRIFMPAGTHLHLDARRQEDGAHDRPRVRPRRLFELAHGAKAATCCSLRWRVSSATRPMVRTLSSAGRASA